MTAQWRSDIDSLAFRPAGHNGWCIVHRRALGTLIGRGATPDACLAWYAGHVALCEQAAAAKIARANLPSATNFHLTSRDIKRATALTLAPG